MEGRRFPSVTGAAGQALNPSIARRGECFGCEDRGDLLLGILLVGLWRVPDRAGDRQAVTIRLVVRLGAGVVLGTAIGLVVALFAGLVITPIFLLLFRAVVGNDDGAFYGLLRVFVAVFGGAAVGVGTGACVYALFSESSPGGAARLGKTAGSVQAIATFVVVLVTPQQGGEIITRPLLWPLWFLGVVLTTYRLDGLIANRRAVG